MKKPNKVSGQNVNLLQGPETGDEVETTVSNISENMPDSFEITIDGSLFPTDFIIGIDLPKFSLGGFLKNTKVEEKTLIGMTLYDIENCSKRILTLAKKRDFEFKITFFDDNRKIRNTWIFNHATIKTIDLGKLTTLPKPGIKDIYCELNFENINIDGVEI